MKRTRSFDISVQTIRYFFLIGELKQAIVAMMLRKDEVEECNRY